MISLVTCDGYRTIRELPRGVDAPAECLAEEERRDDDFRIIACENGRIIADAEGWIEEEGTSQYERRCASFGESE